MVKTRRKKYLSFRSKRMCENGFQRHGTGEFPHRDIRKEMN